MADNGASTNGHRPERRRKRIYPPLEQMAAEQAAAATRPRTSRATRAAVAEPDAAPDLGPEPAAPPAPPIISIARPDDVETTDQADDVGRIDAERF
jgi:hypothetical protein